MKLQIKTIIIVNNKQLGFSNNNLFNYLRANLLKNSRNFHIKNQKNILHPIGYNI